MHSQKSLPRYLPGLSPKEVEHSRKKHGSNIITQKKRKGFIKQYLESFGDPIIKILLIALAINIIFMLRNAGWYESAGIAAAVIIATLVSTLSEYGSESAFEKLQQETASATCRVRRAGSLLLVPVSELVIGDIVLLQAGERIPADGHMLSGELAIDQSSINGESKEAKKTADGTARAGEDLNARGALFQGGVVCGGEGVMQVDRIGDNTFYGKLAGEVQEDAAQSPLKARLSKLAHTISILGYTAAGFIAVATLFNAFVIDSNFNHALIIQKLTNPAFVFSALMETLTLAITVIVMAVPEGLPMMITVVLSANMRKMLKDNVLVRKLVGIETAGSMNILFTDKTGTLTKGSLSVTSFTSGSGTVYPHLRSLPKGTALRDACILNCAYNTDSAVGGQGQRSVIGGNATDRALLEYVLPVLSSAQKVSVVSHQPFDSKNKFSTSCVSKKGKMIYLIKGAPEILLARCTQYLDENGSKKLFKPASIQKNMKALSENSVRMLVLAESESPDFQTLTLVGLIGIRDDIRKESRGALAEIKTAGIQTVMITGDNRETAVAVAKELKLINNTTANAVYTSSELAKMSDDEIRKILPNLRVVARALPTDKSRLVRIAQEMGLVAGMTGDGINDAPALKKADVGFAMGSGTEVAKEAGDIVILDNNIQSISKAILYGRTIFKSIRKFLIFQLTMNFCAVALSVICPFLGIDAPLTVMQMLWVNMIIDTLAGLAFSGEMPQKEYMREPPKHRDEPIMNRYMYSQVLFGAVYTTLLCILFLVLPVTKAIFRFGDGSVYFMTAFFALFIFSGVFNSLNARTHRINLLSHLYGNRMFMVILFTICLTQIILIYLGGSVFRTVGISISHLQLIFILASSVVPVDLIRKFWLRSIGRKGHI